MFNKNQLSKILNKLSFKNTFSFFGSGVEADWKFILVSFVVINIIFIIFNIYIFVKINSGEVFMSDQTKNTEIKTINKSGLDKVVNFYDQKKNIFSDIKKDNTIFEDPSM